MSQLSFCFDVPDVNFGKFDFGDFLNSKASSASFSNVSEIDYSSYKNNLIKRREEIILALSKDISKDESEMLNVELNQIILELTKR